MSEDKMEHARDNAKAHIEGMVRMVKRLDHISECDFTSSVEDCCLSDQEVHEGIGNYYEEGLVATEDDYLEYHDEDKARDAIRDEALGVTVRSGWCSPGEDLIPVEYEILLTTGGPALRITGDLGEFMEPYTARLQMQDWGTPWVDYYPLDDEQRRALLMCAQQHYFSE